MKLSKQGLRAYHRVVTLHNRQAAITASAIAGVTVGAPRPWWARQGYLDLREAEVLLIDEADSFKCGAAIINPDVAVGSDGTIYRLGPTPLND